MSRLTNWWDRRSDPARIELYTRWSFPLFALTEVAVVAGPVGQAAMPVGQRVGWLLLTVAHAALCAVASDRGLDWTLGRREHPARLLAALAGLSAGGALAVLVLYRVGALADSASAMALVACLVGFGTGAMVLGVRRIRVMLYAVPGAAVGTGAAALLTGLSGSDVTVNALAVLVTGAVMAFTNGCSVWLLSTVWELDAAREVQARLAVAEERLRFGRDLHDVMGRNLAVIALKSELAVQLARHGRPEAVEQMIEVQRIARESQREVREVVRGYRRADLAVELAGALSVLRAAGVEGRAEGDGGHTLPTEVQTALGWVIREATTNVLRHSEASHCTIRLSLGGPGTVLSVENDGVPEPAADAGSAPGAAGSDGSGLAGLRERLAVLGGTLSAEPRPGSFRLTAEVPLPHRPASPLLREAGSPA